MHGHGDARVHSRAGLYLLDNELGLGWEFTSELARRVTESGVRAVICPHWLAPDKIEAVLLPESGVGWCVLEPGTAYPAAHRRLHLDRMADAETRSALRAQLRADAKLCDSLLTRGRPMPGRRQKPPRPPRSPIPAPTSTPKP